ncbi:MAG: hypothetical protein RLZZ373_1395 [Pseudomonadota bacterium]|jgi:hypothetical protein
MALRLFDPKTGGFRAITPPVTDLPLSELLLVNILIELQVISMYLHGSSPSNPAEDPHAMRVSATQEY